MVEPERIRQPLKLEARGDETPSFDATDVSNGHPAEMRQRRLCPSVRRSGPAYSSAGFLHAQQDRRYPNPFGGIRGKTLILERTGRLFSEWELNETSEALDAFRNGVAVVDAETGGDTERWLAPYMEASSPLGVLVKFSLQDG